MSLQVVRPSTMTGTITKMALFAALAVNLFYTSAHAQGKFHQVINDQNKQNSDQGQDRKNFHVISKVNTSLTDFRLQNIRDVIGNIAYDRQVDISDAIFNVISQFSISLGKDLELLPRRRVYDNNNGTFTVFESLTLNGSKAKGITPWLSFGTQDGFSVVRIRQVNSPRDNTPLLAESDTFSQTHSQNVISKIASRALSGTTHLINQLFKGIEKSVEFTADFFTDTDEDKVRYHEALSEFRIPAHIPYNAEQMADPRKYQVGDVIAYALNGGIFLNAGKTFNIHVNGNESGAWASVFLRGSWQIGVKKEPNGFAAIRLIKTTADGFSVTPASIKFRVPIIKGFLFGHDLKVGYTPFYKVLETSDFKKLERSYRFDLKTEDGRKAYDAAIFGNFKVTQDLVDQKSTDVTELMIRTSDGKSTRSELKIDLIVGGLNKSKIQTVTHAVMQKPDGITKTVEGVASYNREYNINFLGFKHKERKFSGMETTSILDNDERAAHDLIITSAIEYTNMKSDQKIYKEMIQNIETIVGKDVIEEKLKNRNISGMQKIKLHTEYNLKGIRQITHATDESIWSALGSLLMGDTDIWSTESKRISWLQVNRNNKYKTLQFGWPLIPAPLYLHHATDIANAIQKIKDAKSIENKILILNKMHLRNEFSSFLPKVMATLAGYDNTFFRITLEGDGLEQSVVLEHGKESEISKPIIVDPIGRTDTVSALAPKIIMSEIYERSDSPGKLFLGIESNVDISKQNAIYYEVKTFKWGLRDPSLYTRKAAFTIRSIREKETGSDFRYEAEIDLSGIHNNGDESSTLQIYFATDAGKPISEVQELKFKLPKKK